MGTESLYSVKLKKSPSCKFTDEEIIGELLTPFSDAAYVLNIDGTSYQQGKWYQSEDDLIQLSKKHADVLFTLNLEPEYGLPERSYIFRGRIQRATVNIVFEEFDKSKLEEV